MLTESNFTGVCWLNFDHAEIATKKHCGQQRNNIQQFPNVLGVVGGEVPQNVGPPRRAKGQDSVHKLNCLGRLCMPSDPLVT